jgi:hypothetical protein
MEETAMIRTLACCLIYAAACGGHAPPPPAAKVEAVAAREPEPPAPAAPSMPAPAPPPGSETPASVISSPAAMMVREGLSAPESVLYDIESDVYLVSNVNGSPGDADDNGYISRISPEGRMLDPKFIDGAKDDVQLNAPKGMAIAAGVLYVADLDRIRKFDVQTGKPLGAITQKGVTFANDVASGPDGTIYFTDTGIKLTAKGADRTGTDAVYKIVKDQVRVVARGRNLNGPNGLIVDESGVWVVTAGGKELYNVKSGSKAKTQELPSGVLDGIVKTHTGTFYISSWEKNQVFAGAPGEAFTVAFEAKSPADIGYDVKRNRLLIPLMTENALQIQPL